MRAAAARTHALFDEHSRVIYGLCRVLLRDAHEADDATQATFVAAYGSLLGGTVPLDGGAWLAAIARNECAARARARMRQPLPLVDLEIAVVEGPETELARRDAVEELRRAIADLPERQREAVVLRDLYGLHYAEVGAALGLSVPSVESLLFRARRQLRVRLKPLSGGALVVPLGVREGLAQAVPAFGTAGSSSGALGMGVLAKLVSGPLAVKAIGGAAVVVTAATIAVAGVEHAGDGQPGEAEVGVVAIAPGDAAALAEARAPRPTSKAVRRVVTTRRRAVSGNARVPSVAERPEQDRGHRQSPSNGSHEGRAIRAHAAGDDPAADDEHAGGGEVAVATTVRRGDESDERETSGHDERETSGHDEPETSGHDERDSGSSSEGPTGGSDDGREDGSESESSE